MKRTYTLALILALSAPMLNAREAWRDQLKNWWDYSVATSKSAVNKTKNALSEAKEMAAEKLTPLERWATKNVTDAAQKAQEVATQINTFIGDQASRAIEKTQADYYFTQVTDTLANVTNTVLDVLDEKNTAMKAQLANLASQQLENLKALLKRADDATKEYRDAGARKGVSMLRKASKKIKSAMQDLEKTIAKIQQRKEPLIVETARTGQQWVFAATKAARSAIAQAQELTEEKWPILKQKVLTNVTNIARQVGNLANEAQRRANPAVAKAAVVAAQGMNYLNQAYQAMAEAYGEKSPSIRTALLRNANLLITQALVAGKQAAIQIEKAGLEGQKVIAQNISALAQKADKYLESIEKGEQPDAETAPLLIKGVPMKIDLPKGKGPVIHKGPGPVYTGPVIDKGPGPVRISIEHGPGPVIPPTPTE